METYVDNIVYKIAEKLSNYEQIQATANKPDNLKGLLGNVNIWEKTTLCNGLPGLCMLFGKLMDVYPNEKKWEDIANKYMGYVVQEINNTGIDDISMFTGLTGVGLATACISKKFRQYTNLLHTINESLVSLLPQLLQVACNKMGTYASSYDIISGATGILNYIELFKETPNCYNVLIKGTDILINLTQSIQIKGISVPGFYISGENQFSDIEKELYKDGCINLGLAHGIAGPLVFLSKMVSEGICRNGQKEAIKKIVDFYFRYRIMEEEREIWKGQVELQEIKNGKPSTENIVRRDAWCYGNPGICYALVRAGIALDDNKIINYAIENLKNTVHDIHGIYSPTFCHGYSGIYQIIDSIEKITKSKELEKEKIMLKDTILNFYDANYLYGFYNLEYDYNLGEVRPYETIGFLDGTVGVCLSLISAEYPQSDLWKRAVLLT